MSRKRRQLHLRSETAQAHVAHVTHEEDLEAPMREV
jgi:hypothetical protein